MERAMIKVHDVTMTGRDVTIATTPARRRATTYELEREMRNAAALTVGLGALMFLAFMTVNLAFAIGAGVIMFTVCVAASLRYSSILAERGIHTPLLRMPHTRLHSLTVLNMPIEKGGVHSRVHLQLLTGQTVYRGDRITLDGWQKSAHANAPKITGREFTRSYQHHLMAKHGIFRFTRSLKAKEPAL